MSAEFKDGFLTSLVLVSVFWIGFIFSAIFPLVENHRDIVKHGCAQYDSITGDFKWKDEQK